MPFGELVVGTVVEVGISHGPQQCLEAQLRSSGFLRLDGYYCSHVAADAVASHSEAAAVDTNLLAMLGDPAGGGVSLVDRCGELGLGRWRVIDVDRCRTRAHYQVVDQSLVGRIIAQHPSTTMEEHEHRQVTLSALRPHYPDFQRLAIGLDGTALDLNTGQVDLHACLGACQH